MPLHLAITSMSLGYAHAGHSMRHKLDMAKSYGYKGIELFYADLADLASGLHGGTTTEKELHAAAIIRQMCEDRDLTVINLQPFSNFEGLRDRTEYARRLDELKHWFCLARALGTDMIQIPSTYLRHSQLADDPGQAVADLQEVADMGLAEVPPIRFVHEALCWGTRCNTWQETWEVVQAVDRPNFGLCLDTFNILGRIYADPASATGRTADCDRAVQNSIQAMMSTLDIEKVFYVQVVNAERLSSPLVEGHPFYDPDQPARMSWSRNCRLFYGEQSRGAYLPVIEVARAIFQGLGFEGWVSLELFNRRMSDTEFGVPRELACRGAASWKKLMNDLHFKTKEREERILFYDEIDPDDIDPDDLVRHQCQSLVTLAVMLLEVYFGTPFNMLPKRYGVELGGATSSGNVTYPDADVVFRACREEIPENFQFRSAVEKCLDPTTWEDDDGNRLDDQLLRTTIYEEVVRPLENELTLAYSSISIDDLDRFAQILDFGSWDQTIPISELQSQILNSGDCTENRQSFDLSSESTRPCRAYDSTPRAYIQHRDALAPTCFASTYPTVPSRVSILADPVIDYKQSKFFDDETASEAHTSAACSAYLRWRERYQAVYEKFITLPSQSSLLQPVKIAILDTGIDLTHPDIEARSESIKGRYNWLNEKYRNKVHDRNGHGTFGAGLLLDYAPDAELYIAKIAEDKPSDPIIIAQAIKHAVETWEVDIISMSFGFPTCDIDGYDELETAILNAYSSYVLLFAAASNSGGQRGRAYPARDQNVICIHSTDTNGNRSGFSPTAAPNDINLATVGEAVESSWPVHLCDDITNPSYIRHKSGTSYATPIAAGIAAFLLQYAKMVLPDKAHMLKRQDRMKSVFKRVAEKGPVYEPRDGYHFIDLSLFSDTLFGKSKGFIDHTIGDLLSN